MPDFQDTIYTDKPHQYQATHVRQGFGEIVMIDPVSGDGPRLLAHGPRLRDALLEAFPLPVATPSGAADRMADWEKEVFQKAFSTPLDPAVFKADKVTPSVVPGMVFRWSACTFTVLPDDSYYASGHVYKYTPYSVWQAKNGYDLVFDPRDAVALPSPLGIRVGDTVRRVQDINGVTVTIEFEVSHIDGTTGSISYKYGLPYPPKGFKVTSREVPDRLPAGTIVRSTEGAERLYLITSDTALPLHATWRDRDNSDFAGLVKKGRFEVIYLPES